MRKIVTLLNMCKRLKQKCWLSYKIYQLIKTYRLGNWLRLCTTKCPCLSCSSNPLYPFSPNCQDCWSPSTSKLFRRCKRSTNRRQMTKTCNDLRRHVLSLVVRPRCSGKFGNFSNTYLAEFRHDRARRPCEGPRWG